MSLAARLQAGRLGRLGITTYWMARFLATAIRERSGAFLRFQPGYHGSNIPSGKFLARNRERLFNALPGNDGIDLNRERQETLLAKFVTYYPDFQPPRERAADRLYHYDNAMFGFSDAFVLYCMLREFRPRRVIELGSGYSSALMLDVSREFLPDTRFTFIDPYSTTIQRVLASNPEGHYELIRQEAQDVDKALFASLGEGDILFVDTSHVVKIGSDLSTIFFSILPALPAGTIVHIHDIFFPWEYPEDFVMEGRTYNELYFVRAFLQFNDAFEILYNSAQIAFEHPLDTLMPGYHKDAGTRTSQSLWLRKVR